MVTVRVNEILCALEHIKKATPEAVSFRFETSGGGGILALVTGLFEEKISAICAGGMLESYSGIIENRNTFINDADIIVNFAEYFDIDDLIKANGDKKITLTDPTDPFGKRSR